MKKVNPQEINRFFEEAYYANASDLHLAVGLPPAVRINGELVELSQYGVFEPRQLEEMILSILSEGQRKTYLEKRELDFGYMIPNIARFRVNIHWEKEHAGLVARVVSNKIPTMEEINLPTVVKELINLRQGLILVTGPTGCGKSTTLAAMIEYINNERPEHIITLEDPIEFIFESKKSLIRQRQLYTDFLSFAEALKHVVRQDPNVIMVGEMRDLETVAAALTVAETGHLVFATLHTLNAAQTVDRIVDIFPPYQQEQIRLQLSTVLRGVISQQLIPNKTGGRSAAREIMINIPAVANLIRENKISQLKTVIQTNGELGMQTIDQDVRRLYENGMIAFEIARSYMLNPESIEKKEE